MALPVPASCFAALAPLHQNHGRDHQKRPRQKSP